MSKKDLLVLVLGALLTGCAGSPKTNLYVLEAKNQPLAKKGDQAKKRMIGIGPITIPGLLERKQIVTRTDNNSIQVSEFHQWAAPLKEAIPQVLAENLSRLQPDELVKAYPWAAYGMVDYHVIVDISRFDTQPGKSVNLEATWSIMDDKTHALTINGKTKIQQALPDSSYAATVDALSKILSDFSQEISVGLHKL